MYLAYARKQNSIQMGRDGIFLYYMFSYVECKVSFKNFSIIYEYVGT